MKNNGFFHTYSFRSKGDFSEELKIKMCTCAVVQFKLYNIQRERLKIISYLVFPRLGAKYYILGIVIYIAFAEKFK